MHIGHPIIHTIGLWCGSEMLVNRILFHLERGTECNLSIRNCVPPTSYRRWDISQLKSLTTYAWQIITYIDNSISCSILCQML
jgi:hypothetical protein